MLEASILINLILGRWADAAFITVLLVFQALLGFYQERNAKRAVSLLKSRLSIAVKVKRDGRWQTLPSSEIVPGDYVYLRAGDIVPADIRITEGFILVNQSQLTGEPLPVEVGEGGTAYAGSLVVQGEAYGVVSATGERTHYGKAASLVRLAEHPTLLQQLALRVAKVLLVFDAFLAVIAFTVMVASGAELLSTLAFVIMLLVLSVPVALPVMSTLSATLGAGQLAGMGVLTTRLSAIEDAAAMDVLCIDKTGTLTENKPKVEKVVPLSNYSEDEILYFAARTVPPATPDPLSLAILDSAKGRNTAVGEGAPAQTVFEPFDPKTKSSGARFPMNGKQLRVVKGDPVSLAKLAGVPYEKIADNVSALSQSGERVLAVALGDDSKLELIGLIAFADPVRPDAAELVSRLENKGVRIVLLTGDVKSTAEAVAKKVGIEGEPAPEDIDYESISPEVAEKYSIFSRVLPEDKYYIVRALQKAGHVVGMTGDGINDAPALRQANVGIATANALDVAKAAAGFVLTKPGLTGIPVIVNVSRSIHQRVKTWTLAMITRKLAIPALIVFSLLLFREPAITPLLAFIFMLFGDIITFSLSKDNVVPSSKPNRWDLRTPTIYASAYASIMFLMSIIILWVARRVAGLPIEQTQTVVFAWLVLVAGQAVLYLVRTRKYFWSKPHPGRFLLATTILTFLLTFAMSTVGILVQPIPASLFGILSAAAFCYVLIGNGALLALSRLGVSLE